MTTMLSPEVTTWAERNQRVLPIAANLLPDEVVDARRARVVRRVVLGVLAAVTALLVAWYGLASYEATRARDELAAVQDEVQRLTRQQKDYDELVRTQADSKAIRAQLAQLLAKDLRWASVVAALQQAAPAGVELTGLNANLAEEDDKAKADSETVGSMTITGTAGGKPAVAAYVDALAKVPGLAAPFLTSTTEKEGKWQFSVEVDVTKAALGGRYTTHLKAGK